MEGELIQIAASQGIWAVLSVSLIFYVLKTQENRENRYQEIITQLTEELKIVSEINQNIKKLIAENT